MKLLEVADAMMDQGLVPAAGCSPRPAGSTLTQRATTAQTSQFWLPDSFGVMSSFETLFPLLATREVADLLSHVLKSRVSKADVQTGLGTKEEASGERRSPTAALFQSQLQTALSN